MKGKDLYRKMDLIDDEIIEKNSKERYKKSNKSLMIALIAAALAVATLCAFILPAMLRTDDPVPTDSESDWASPVFTDETDARTTPIYDPSNGSTFQYLTAKEFAPTRESGQVSEEFREVAAHFALELLKNSKDSYTGDALLVSPLSAMLALAMTANGADGETLREMEETLACGMYIGRLNQELFDYTSSLISTDDARFNLANAVYVTSSPLFSINKNFVKTIENTYDADIISVDMSDYATIDAINNWVKEETFGMIDSIANENNVNASTVMVLLNAIAMDALWSSQVADEACFEDSFNGEEGATFMNAPCNAYIEGENEIGIVKNYKGGNYAFVALLPKNNISTLSYMETLSGHKFLELFDSRIEASGNTKVTAKMPHFEFDCEINLTETLNNMGMNIAFDPYRADFSALGAMTDGSLYIAGVGQKTHIELDNSGTRAAAVTAVIMAATSIPTITKNYKVDLDRPFVYAIVDTATGLPIFIGTCEHVN